MNNTPTGHALCSPSGAERWMFCAGSVAMEFIEPPSTSEYAEEGTRAHFLAGVYFAVHEGAAATPTVTDAYPQEMHDYIKGYVDDILEVVENYKRAGALSVQLFVEQALPLESITGEKDAFGTSDVVILAEFKEHHVLDVRDLKYGMGVKVSAIDNPQCNIYAAAALVKFGALIKKPIERITIAIHQPRVSETPSEWEISAFTLKKWIDEAVTPKAQVALHLVKQARPSEVRMHLNPSEDACRFCRAAATCPALANKVHETVMGDFQDITDATAAPVTPQTTVLSEEDYHKLLPLFMTRAPMIENWCTAVRAKVESELMAGRPVENFKLVEGRRGHRKWTEAEKVRGYLSLAAVEPKRYLTEPELKTPAALEKDLGKKKGPEADKAVWSALQAMIEQPDGKPSVAPESDERPVWVPKASVDDFESHDVSDLF